jgi:hypothetical protein
VITIPYWWNDSEDSLLATIYQHRPELKQVIGIPTTGIIFIEFHSLCLAQPIPERATMDEVGTQERYLYEPMKSLLWIEQPG